MWTERADKDIERWADCGYRAVVLKVGVQNFGDKYGWNMPSTNYTAGSRMLGCLLLTNYTWYLHGDKTSEMVTRSHWILNNVSFAHLSSPAKRSKLNPLLILAMNAPSNILRTDELYIRYHSEYTFFSAVANSRSQYIFYEIEEHGSQVTV